MMNKTKKRLAVRAALSAILSLALAGCGTPAASGNTSNGSTSSNQTTNSGSSKQLTTVRYSEVIRSIFYAPQYVAMAKGFFTKEGLNVQMVTSEGSNKGAAALLSGSADIALVGPETSVYIYNQHGSQTLKVFYQLTNTDGSFLMSRKKIPNFTWQDVAGKSIISWRPGSDPQMVLAHVLKSNHVSGTNVITNIAPQAMVGAFESGKAPFIQVYEPVASDLAASGKAYYDMSIGQAVGNYPETAFEATASYIKNHPQVIQDWSNAVYQATQWIGSHTPNQVAAAIASYFPGTSQSLIADSVKKYEELKTWSSPVLIPKQLDTLQTILIESGTEKASQKISYNDVVDPTFAQKAEGSAK